MLANQVKIFPLLFQKHLQVNVLFNVSDTEYKFIIHFYDLNLAIESTERSLS
jgi:hypothetical protein